MYLNTEKKQQIFSQYGGSETNTGAAESQIALFTHRIKHLTEHLKVHRKDYSTQLSLVKLVGKRRDLLNYLHRIDISRYRAIIEKLELRK
jgi:small subunit ribosomal protein S15